MPLSKLTAASLEDIGYIVDPAEVGGGQIGLFCSINAYRIAPFLPGTLMQRSSLVRQDVVLGRPPLDLRLSGLASPSWCASAPPGAGKSGGLLPLLLCALVKTVVPAFMSWLRQSLPRLTCLTSIGFRILVFARQTVGGTEDIPFP